MEGVRKGEGGKECSGRNMHKFIRDRHRDTDNCPGRNMHKLIETDTEIQTIAQEEKYKLIETDKDTEI